MAGVLQVERMTVEEKLRAMEEIWENLSRTEENIPVPQWHKDLLDERERLVREGKDGSAVGRRQKSASPAALRENRDSRSGSYREGQMLSPVLIFSSANFAL